ncbi:hypothetical protein SCHPADRAFT_931821 [Schizopora paradoxa]|uniref:BTB domain-containing protein n=1 Tax=Schizopora paradoxa TaxID=27342 RepID=A0A0H2RAJ7_9AGAM|nr:hypothetical protein SCHPADRAFT_931821 [Schizopora paradoxa]
MLAFDRDMDVDSPQKHSHIAPRKHDHLWLSDGNVVLETDSLLFKVHKSILSMQSTVFKAMFELSDRDDDDDDDTKSDDDEMKGGSARYEGLPLVRLDGDRGSDVVHLLCAAYERQYYYRDNDATPLEVITALLTLSTKYDFKHIRRDVILQISRHYPMTMAAYEAIDNDKAPMFGEAREDCHYPLLKAVFAAKVDALLPILYYACADYTIDTMIDWWDTLDPACLKALLKGKDMITFATGSLITKLPEDVHGGSIACPNIPSCIGSARFSGFAKFLQLTDLKHFEGSKVVKICIRNACPMCTKVLADRINERREKIWNDIPSFFGFRDWGELWRKLAEDCKV